MYAPAPEDVHAGVNVPPAQRVLPIVCSMMFILLLDLWSEHYRHAARQQKGVRHRARYYGTYSERRASTNNEGFQRNFCVGRRSLYEERRCAANTGTRNLPRRTCRGRQPLLPMFIRAGRPMRHPPSDADCGSRVPVMGLARHATGRWELQCSLRPHSRTRDWATRKRLRGGNAARDLNQSERVTNPVRGLRVTVERVQGRWLLRPQQCGRGARENWRTRVRTAKAVGLAESSNDFGVPRGRFLDVMHVSSHMAGQASDVDDCAEYRRGLGILPPGKPLKCGERTQNIAQSESTC